MADIDLRKIQPGQKASDVSNDLSYNFNALLSVLFYHKQKQLLV